MKKLYLAVLFCIIGFFASSQWKYTTYSVPSPNAASLGVYGEIPVSYYTGTPNVSIPLYEIKGNRISLPATLSYHPAIRPDAHPGWIGLGWSLICGGAITRKMNRMPDELQASAFGFKGYYFTYNNINNSNWASGLSTYNTYAIGTDIEPDEFSFSFLGMSGKFFLDHTGQWKVQSDRELKVVFNSTDFMYPFIYSNSYTGSTSQYVTKTFKQFTIIDEKGNKYTFGGPESAIEYSEEIGPILSRRGELFYATSWFLTRIESAVGVEVINLNYIRGPFTSYLYKGYNSMYTNASYGAFLNPGCSSSSASVKRNGKVISPVYLSYIEMPSKYLRIDFLGSKCNDLTYIDQEYDNVMHDIYGAATTDQYELLDYNSTLNFDNPSDASLTPKYKRFIWRKLDQISILQTATNTILKKIALNYTELTTRRLRLNSVVTRDNSNTTVFTTSFTYNDDVFLPDYMTKIGDHWGFNNNANLPSSIVATDFLAVRQPNEFYTKAEVLKEIIYPTGGSTEFEFELNKYSKYVSQDRQTTIGETGDAGGLRLKKLITKDNGNVQQAIEYFYVQNYTPGSNPALLTSSGILDTKPKYTFNNLNGVDYNNVAFTYGFTSSNVIIPLSQNSSGTHISYSEVVEKRADNSYSIHKFTNHDNGFKDSPPVAIFNRENVAYYPFSSRDFERGQLVSKADYKNTGKIVREMINEYARVNESQKAARAIENSFFIVCAQSAARQAVSRSAYFLYYYPFVLAKQTIKEYPSAENLTFANTTEKTLIFDDNKNIKEQRFTNSRSESIITKYKYPGDYPADGTLTAMTNAHIISAAVETAVTNNGSNVNLMHVNYFSPSSGIYVPQTIQGQIGTNAIETREQFHQYDNKGNLQDASKTNDIHTVYLWGYKSQHIVAKITGSTYSAVQAAMTQSGITQTQLDDAATVLTDAQLRNLLNGLRTSLAGAFVSTYTWSPFFGLTSETDERNKTIYYEYDLMQRLSLIRDHDGNIIKTYKYQYKQ